MLRAHGCAGAADDVGGKTEKQADSDESEIAPLVHIGPAPAVFERLTMGSVGTPLMWSLFATFVVIALLVDFLTLSKQGAHKVSLREAAVWSLMWVAVSAAFAAWLWWHLRASPDESIRALADTKLLEFVTGYLIEKALAVDNVFVFLMVFTYFSVPAEFQKRVLMIGVLAALVLRAVMILVGAWMITRFHWLLYVFGAFLVFTGIKMWWAAGQEPDLDSNPLLKWLRGRMRIAPHFDGDRLVTRVDGVRMATPLALVVLLIGIVDVVFAVDSIPAIFAITTDPFIVLTSNVFAILGLRALYFLLAGIHERFHLLSYGLAVVLLFIGTKMLLIDIYKIPVSISLLTTAGILAVSMILSQIVAPRGTCGTAYPFTRKRKEARSD